jgi:hypothetical protein
MPQEKKVTLALPENLQRQFAALQKRLFSLETAFAIAAGVSALLLSYLVLFVSDRFWDTPRALRAALLAAAVAGAAAAAIWWMRHWVFKRRDWRALAVIVQRKYPRLGDRLLGIVELAEESKRPAYFSPELYHAAIAQVAEESEKFDFVKAGDARRTRRQIVGAGSLLALAALSILLLPAAAFNSLRRWVAPLAKIPRFTLVQFAEIAPQRIVPHGERATLRGALEYRSFWRPARVKLRLASGQLLSATARDGKFEMELPPQFKDATVRLAAGDTSAAVDLLVRNRPALQGASAQITLPEYLQYPLQQESAESGLLEVLEGSSVSLSARVSRELHSASFQLGDAPWQPARLSSNTVSTPAFTADAASQVALQWQDTLGLTNQAPWRLALQTKKDTAPIPEIEELYRDVAILETEVLPIPLRAQDDFGVRTLGLNWVVLDPESTNSAGGKDYTHDTRTNALTYLEHTYNFSPAVMGIPPENTVEIRAFATDYLPGRPRSESPVYRIHVLGNAQHAEMVRLNLESLLVQLEEVTRLQERLTSETRDLKDLQKLDSAEAVKKIEELEKLQEQNAAQLQEMASEGMKSLREALRNPAFNEQVLTEWTKNLHEMQKLAQQQMKEAAQSLQQAAQSEQSREEQLAEAQKKEEESLEGLQQMQEKVNAGLDELQALTLAQRLRQLSAKEKRIETTLQSSIPDTIGLLTNQLSARYLRANSQLAASQNETQAESAKLQGEISRFYERTQKPNYGDVTKQMSDSRAPEELERLRDLIKDNIGMEAMQNLALWSNRFEEWAAMLEPKSDPSDGSGAGQGGSGEKDDTALKQLMALLRIRERQVNIQGRTQLLHEHIQERTAYRDGAVLLAASQGKLNRDISQEAVANTFPILEEAYDDTVTSMSDVESLLDRPRTDEVTRSAQNKSLANLTDLINLLNEEAKKQPSSSSQSQGQSPSSEQMAFLMQMMMPQPGQQMSGGQQAGANMSGGSTDRALQGGSDADAAGKAGDGRTAKKSTGVPQNYPAEFRDALENYFKALEGMENR